MSETAVRQEFKPVPALHTGHQALVVNSGNVIAEVICQEDKAVVYRDSLFDHYPKAQHHIGHKVEITHVKSKVLTHNGHNSIDCIECHQVIYYEKAE